MSAQAFCRRRTIFPATGLVVCLDDERGAGEFRLQIAHSNQIVISENVRHDHEVGSQMKKAMKHVYDVRSAVIHGPKDDKKKRLPEEMNKAFVAGFDLARQSLFKMLLDGPPRQ